MRSRDRLMMRDSHISSNRLFVIGWASHMHALAPFPVISSVCGYRLFNFQSKTVQMFGRSCEHFSFPVGGKTTY